MKWFLAFAVSVVLLSYAGTGYSHEHATRAELMAEDTRALLRTFTHEQKALGVRQVDDQAARTSWHYLPQDLTTRTGITLGQLTPAQRTSVHKMRIGALSSQGYGKLTHIMWLEEVLRASEAAALSTTTVQGAALKQQQARWASRDPSKYWIVVFGDPGSASWGWTFSGHHFAVNFTVVNGRVAFTPLFTGANPQTVLSGEHVGERTLQHEIDKAFRLVRSLDQKQREVAVLSSNVPPTIFADKGKKDAVTAFEGVRANQLDAGQRELLMSLVDEFLGDTSEEAAAAQRASIFKDGLNALRFAWWGQTEDQAKRFVYRIHGPSILIELSREQNPDGTPANHIHSIVRDPRNDYGEGWLRQHFQEFHQP
jgi:hypothetical protein